MKKSLIVFWAVFLALSFEACNRSSINPEEEKAAAMADSIYGAITDIERLESLRDSLLLKNDILRLTFVYKQLGLLNERIRWKSSGLIIIWEPITGGWE